MYLNLKKKKKTNVLPTLQIFRRKKNRNTFFSKKKLHEDQMHKSIHGPVKEVAVKE